MPYVKKHRDIRGSLGLSFPIYNMRLSQDGGASGLALTYTKRASPPTRPCRIPILTEGSKLGIRTSAEGEKVALLVTHARTRKEHVFLFRDPEIMRKTAFSSVPAAWVTRIIDAFETTGAATRLGQHITAGFRECRFRLGGKQLVAQVPESCHDLSVTVKPATYALGRLKTPACLSIQGHDLHLTLHLATTDAAVSPQNIADAKLKFQQEFSAYTSSTAAVNFQQMDLLSCDEGCGYALLADGQDPFNPRKQIFSGISGRTLTFKEGVSAFFVVDFLHSVLDRDLATAEARKNAMVFACSLRVGSGTSRFPSENKIDPVPHAISGAEAADYSTSSSASSSSDDDNSDDNSDEETSGESSDQESLILSSSPSLPTRPTLASRRPRAPPPPPPPPARNSQNLVLKLKAIGAAAELAVSGFHVKRTTVVATSPAFRSGPPISAPPPPPPPKAARPAAILTARPTAPSSSSEASGEEDTMDLVQRFKNLPEERGLIKSRPVVAPPGPPTMTRPTMAPPGPPTMTRPTMAPPPTPPTANSASESEDDEDAQSIDHLSLMKRFKNLSGESPSIKPRDPRMENRPTMAPPLPPPMVSGASESEDAQSEEDDDLAQRFESMLPEWRELV
jgi:hypothetical protein